MLSTAPRPAHTHLESHPEALTGSDGVQDFDLTYVKIFFAHLFRAGSQIRISIDTSSGNQPVWVMNIINDDDRVTIRLAIITPQRSCSRCARHQGTC